MLGFRSVVAWVMALMAMASFPLAVTAAPLDEIGTSNSLTARAVVPWEARHRLTYDGYRNTNNDLGNKGYRVKSVSTYYIGNAVQFAAIWEKDGILDRFSPFALTSPQYQSQVTYYASKGYRVISVNGWRDASGKNAFSAVFEKAPGPQWVARHDLTASQYQSAFESFFKQGYRLKHVSGYQSGNQALYAAIWEKPNTNVAWVARHGLTSSQYQQATNQYVAQGYRTVFVNAYVINNVDYYAAIWDKSAGPWVARHALTSSGYQAEVKKWVAQGYRIAVVSGYTLNSNQDRYAAIFTK